MPAILRPCAPVADDPSSSAPPEGETEALRLTRDHGDRGPSLVERLSDRIDRLSFASPIHRMRLKGRFPLKLLAVPEDPVAGDTKTGARLKGGRLFLAGYGEAMAEAKFGSPAAPQAWVHWVHSWGWLRDIASVQPLAAAEVARVEALTHRWLERYHDYDEAAWAPQLTGRRILMAIAHAPLVMPGHDHIHRSAVLNGIARWARHLDRATPRMPEGFAKAEALAGLLGAALLLPGGDDRQAKAEAMLAATLDTLLREDGTPASRSPYDLARVGDLLLTLEQFYLARGLRPAAVVASALARVRSGLSALSMGNGLPSPWHGGQPTLAQMARLAPKSGKTIERRSGFQRMAAGNTLLVMDACPPPPARLSDTAHASTLAITMSDGPRMLIVSCGGERGGATEGARAFPSDLVMGLRSTAGHSALVLADTNSSRLADGGPRKLGGVEEVLAESRSSSEGHWLEARHDGYRRRFGYDHVRRLYLSADGQDLRGEDQLVPAKAGLALAARRDTHSIAIRFHLGLGCEATVTQDGRGALINMPAGRPQDRAAWAFRASFNSAPGTLSVEPSLLIDSEGEMHQIQQLLLVSQSSEGKMASIGWSFRRQGKS